MEPKEKKMWPPARTDFGKPPPDYVPGQGRGAIGFITRLDIGPANTKSEAGPQNGNGMSEERDLGDYNDCNYDEWNGYSGPLFAQGSLDEDDREADKVYKYIDIRLDERRKKQREAKLKEELKKYKKEKPSISVQFSDLKRELSTVSQQQWDAIPDIGDYTIKKNKQDKYIPVPDSIIESARHDGGTQNVVLNMEGMQSSVENLNDLGKARNTVLGVKLDKQSNDVEGMKTVDKKGYLTDLASIPINNEADIGDFKKARILIKNLINNNPKNSNAWLAAARIEELDGKLQSARNIINQALSECEFVEDIWIEAARLYPPDRVRSLLAKAIQTLPKSLKIWQKAASIEQDDEIKKKILKRALENIPNNPKLWKEIIELEKNEEEAKQLLYKAVQCVPGNLEMWIALAKLETYENAKKVLNQARKALPTEHTIWIHGAKLEESAGKGQYIIDEFLKRSVEVLKKNGYILNREEWINEAESSQKENPLTCQAIIKAVIGEGIEDLERERVWLDDADNLAERGSMIASRAVYNYCIQQLPNTKKVFLRAIDIERKYARGTEEDKMQFDKLLKQAVEKHPDDEQFWINIIRRNWLNKEQCRQILLQAENSLPKNENIMLLLSKFEKQDQNIEKARFYIQKAFNSMKQSNKVWKHSMKLEFQAGDLKKSWEYAQQALEKYPANDGIIVLAAKIALKFSGIEEARKIFKNATDAIKNSAILWCEYAEMEISNKQFVRARPILEAARIKITNNQDLWYLSVILEIEDNNKKGASFMLSRGLKECPNSGQLWALAIELEPRNTRKKKIVEAVKLISDDPYINLAIAKTFWKEKKLEKAERWLEKAIQIDPNIGDNWACYYVFESEKENNSQKLAEIVQKVNDHNPKQGRIWNQIKKGTEQGWKLNNSNILLEASKLIYKDLVKIE